MLSAISFQLPICSCRRNDNHQDPNFEKKPHQECISEHRTTGIYLFESFEHVLKLLSFGGNQMVGVFGLKEERSHKHL